MTKVILLDSGPLGLIVHKLGVKAADDCRHWLSAHIQLGAKVFVPAIIDYELRRELLRLGKAQSIADLDAFESAVADRVLPLTTQSLRKAAELWAEARRQGIPTAAPSELDIDVILAAQALNLNIPALDFVVATTNIAHLSRFVPAELWSSI